MRIYKFIFFAVIFVVVSISSITSVKAQYDVDVIEPSYKDGGEVFGVDVETPKKVSIYPEGCKSIERIIFDLKNEVNGEIRIVSKGVESPQADKSLDKVYEYCEIQYTNLDSDDFNSIQVDVKIRKTWFDNENVNVDDIGIYSWLNNEWKYNDTNKESDNSVYNFYKADLEYTSFLAIAEYKEASELPFNINPWILVICCIVFLFFMLILSILATLLRRTNKKQGYNT